VVHISCGVFAHITVVHSILVILESIDNLISNGDWSVLEDSVEHLFLITNGNVNSTTDYGY